MSTENKVMMGFGIFTIAMLGLALYFQDNMLHMMWDDVSKEIACDIVKQEFLKITCN